MFFSISSCLQQQEITPVKNSNGKVTLECVVPFDDLKKKEAFKNFETDVLPIFPDYDIHLSQKS